MYILTISLCSIDSNQQYTGLAFKPDEQSMSDITDRQSPRIELSQPMLLLDLINGGVFGELVNITAEGMMAVITQNLPAQSIYQLSLQLPEAIDGDREITLGIDCLWCRQADSPQRYWAGFQIIDASDRALEQLATLLEKYAK